MFKKEIAKFSLKRKLKTLPFLRILRIFVFLPIPRKNEICKVKEIAFFTGT